MEWIEAVKARGLGAALHLALDVLEPLGPLGAQLLYVARPLSDLFGAGSAFMAIATALEEPGGVDRLRQMLDDA
jgi:hypothetical protein